MVLRGRCFTLYHISHAVMDKLQEKTVVGAPSSEMGKSVLNFPFLFIR